MRRAPACVCVCMCSTLSHRPPPLSQSAIAMGADAVIGTRYDSSPLEQVGATDIFAYGTAVNIAPSKTGRGKVSIPLM